MNTSSVFNTTSVGDNINTDDIDINYSTSNASIVGIQDTNTEPL